MGNIFLHKLHISMKLIHSFRRAVPSESLTFLRSDDDKHRILTYEHYEEDFPAEDYSPSNYAVVTLPWKSFRILQQSEGFQKRDYNCCSRYQWLHFEGSYFGLPKIGSVVFQDVFHPMGSPHWFTNPGRSFHQWVELNDPILGTIYEKIHNRWITTPIKHLFLDEAAWV